MLSIIFGSAFEVDRDESEGNWRLYKTKGRTFMGSDTHDIAHVCDMGCAATVLAEFPNLIECNNGDLFVRLEPERYTDGTPTDKFPTADIVDYDAGDDPYVLCAACDTELYRDDEAYEAEYGRPIDGHRASTFRDPLSPDAMRWTPEHADEEMAQWESILRPSTEETTP